MTIKKAYLAVGLLAALAAGAAWSAEKPEAAAKTEAKGAWPAGYRGFSIPLSGPRMAFVKKGDRLDVIVEFEAQMTDRKEKVAATILQNVVVSEVHPPATFEGAGAVEVIVNPNEAQYAALSLAQGEIHVSRRAPGDVEMHPMEMASFRKLFK